MRVLVFVRLSNLSAYEFPLVSFAQVDKKSARVLYVRWCVVVGGYETGSRHSLKGVSIVVFAFGHRCHAGLTPERCGSVGSEGGGHPHHFRTTSS